MNNPLLNKFETPFETAPFGEIKNEHFLPAIKEGIRLGKEDIAKIKNNPERPTFSNVSEALDLGGNPWGPFPPSFLTFTRQNPLTNYKILPKRFLPLLTDYSNDITLDEELFEKVKNRL